MRAIRSKMVLKARLRSVPVCSAVGESICQHLATALVFIRTRLRYASPTFYREFFQLILQIDLLAVEKVENADDLGDLGREEEELVVWTDAVGGNLRGCQADATRVIFGADTCLAAGTHVIDAAPTVLLCVLNCR